MSLHYTVKTSAFNNIVPEGSGSNIITTITLPSPAWSKCGTVGEPLIFDFAVLVRLTFLSRETILTWWALPLTDDWLCLIWYLDVDKLMLT